MPDVDIVPEFTEETYKAIWERVIANPKLRPIHIRFDEPYDKIAFYLEHGTGPAAPGKKEGPRSDGLTARQRIGAWVDVQYPELKGSEAAHNEMYERIMRTGTPPHPSIRPAVEDVIESGEAGRILTGGGTTMDVADRIVEGIKRNLEMGDHVKFSVNSDSIVKHIHAVPFDDREMGQSSEVTFHDVLKDWKALDDKNYAEHQSRLAQYLSMKNRR